MFDLKPEIDEAMWSLDALILSLLTKREREALLGLKVSHISQSSEHKRTHLYLLGYHIGRVHVIFLLPKKSHHILFNKPAHQISQHLAYVEWYTQINDPMSHHFLHKVSTMKDPKGYYICSIVPIDWIQCSVHLFPRFRAHTPQEWTSSNILDMCQMFFINVFMDHHLYQIMY
jgi:hypothetical protein